MHKGINHCMNSLDLWLFLGGIIAVSVAPPIPTTLRVKGSKDRALSLRIKGDKAVSIGLFI